MENFTVHDMADERSSARERILQPPEMRDLEWKPFQKEWLRQARKDQRRFPEDEWGGFG